MKRHEEAIIYALNEIKISKIAPYVLDVILFGSCARKEEKYESDIDLLLVLNEKAKEHEYHKAIILLKGSVSSPEINAAEVDLKITFNNDWQSSNNTIYNCIKKDGIRIWKKGE